MSILNGIKTANSLIGGSLSGASLETLLGTGTSNAGFVGVLNTSSISRMLSESYTAMAQLVLSSKAIRLVSRSSISRQIFADAIGASQSLVNAASSTRALHIEYGRLPGAQKYLASKHTFPSITLPNLSWRGIAYNGNDDNPIFVAVGTAASSANTTTAASSVDGVTWTSRTVPSLSYRSVAYGNGLFVAVGFNGLNTNTTTYATSPDGITWTSRTLPVSNTYTSVKFLKDKFYATCTSSGATTTTIFSSIDGISWVTNTIPTATWQNTAYGNGVFVAVSATSGVAASSTDGVTWTSRSITAARAFLGVTYGNGVFVAVCSASVGGSASVDGAYSYDGITWTSNVMPSLAWSSVTYANGLFIAMGTESSLGTTATYATSTDGVSWGPRTGSVTHNYKDIVYGNGVFVVAMASIGDGLTTAGTISI